MWESRRKSRHAWNTVKKQTKGEKKMQTIDEKVLALDLTRLTAEELAWLHDLKNRATALQGRLQLKHVKGVPHEYR
jgi:hypothetical protein